MCAPVCISSGSSIHVDCHRCNEMHCHLTTHKRNRSCMRAHRYLAHLQAALGAVVEQLGMPLDRLPHAQKVRVAPASHQGQGQGGGGAGSGTGGGAGGSGGEGIARSMLTRVASSAKLMAQGILTLPSGMRRTSSAAAVGQASSSQGTAGTANPFSGAGGTGHAGAVAGTGGGAGTGGPQGAGAAGPGAPTVPHQEPFPLALSLPGPEMSGEEAGEQLLYVAALMEVHGPTLRSLLQEVREHAYGMGALPAWGLRLAGRLSVVCS